VLGEGRQEESATLTIAMAGCEAPTITPGWTYAATGKGGLGGPAVLALDFLVPGLGDSLSDWNPKPDFSEYTLANQAPTLDGVTLPGGAAIAYAVQGSNGVDIVASFYDANLDRWSLPRHWRRAFRWFSTTATQRMAECRSEPLRRSRMRWLAEQDSR